MKCFFRNLEIPIIDNYIKYWINNKKKQHKPNGRHLKIFNFFYNMKKVKQNVLNTF